MFTYLFYEGIRIADKDKIRISAYPELRLFDYHLVPGQSLHMNCPVRHNRLLKHSFTKVCLLNVRFG